MLCAVEKVWAHGGQETPAKPDVLVGGDVVEVVRRQSCWYFLKVPSCIVTKPPKLVSSVLALSEYGGFRFSEFQLYPTNMTYSTPVMWWKGAGEVAGDGLVVCDGFH